MCIELGKLTLCASIACDSISTAAEILNPARAAPKLNPPAPANRSITLVIASPSSRAHNKLIVYFTL